MKIMKNTKKFIIAFYTLSLCICSFHAFSQESEDKSDWSDRFFTGGNIGLSFGKVTNIEISPIIGYNINERIAVGTGFVYRYYNDKRYSPSAQFDILGFRIFSRLNIVYGFFAHAEYEYIRFRTNIYYDLNVTETYNLNSFLIGGGYKYEVGHNTYLTAIVLYNLTEELYTPYNNPIIRIGVDIGL
jgi:hypothetical protein